MNCSMQMLYIFQGECHHYEIGQNLNSLFLINLQLFVVCTVHHCELSPQKFLSQGWIHSLPTLLPTLLPYSNSEQAGQNSFWETSQQNAYAPLAFSKYSVLRHKWWIGLVVTVGTGVKLTPYDELPPGEFSVMVIIIHGSFPCICCIPAWILAKLKDDVEQISILSGPWSLCSLFTEKVWLLE